MCLYFCLSGWLFVCLFVCLFSTDISQKPRVQILSNFFVHVTCGRGSVLLWLQCDTLCTSGAVDAIMFSHDRVNKQNQRCVVFRWVRQVAPSVGHQTTTYDIMFSRDHQVAVVGAKSVVSDWIFFLVTSLRNLATEQFCASHPSDLHDANQHSVVIKLICVWHRLTEVLQEMGRSDWQLAAMVCKTLWNFSCKITSADACFGSGAAVSELVDSLTELLGMLVLIVTEQRRCT